MLKHRLITGLLLAVTTVSVLLWLPHFAVAVLMFLVILVAGWEWSGLVGLKSPNFRLLYVTVLGLVLAVSWYFYASGPNLSLIFGITALWWVSVLVVLAAAEPRSQPAIGVRHPLQIALLFAGLLTLVPCWLTANMLHELQPGLLLFLFVLVWTADSMAFFTGKRFGKTKLAPALSPGKTREGLWGALFGAVFLALLMAFGLGLPLSFVFYFVGLCLVTTLFSVAGDLFESLLKRLAGVKDSGNILPGHGGVLDRIDSLTAAIPIFTMGLYWVGWPEKIPT